MKRILLITTLLISASAFSQFAFNTQYMNRVEYLNGQGKLVQDGQKPGFFLSQRIRFGSSYSYDRFKINFTAQDVRVWGSTSNLAQDNNGFLSLYEGNVDLKLSEKFSLKAGRQAIAYDDHRIFGSLDWAMQGRRHDALIFKYKDSTLKVDAGFAYNQNNASNSFIQYTVANNYQNFQYLWLNKKLGKNSLSFLFLNNGVIYSGLNTNTNAIDTAIAYSQTIGIRNERKGDKLNLLAYAYYQGGSVLGRTTNAYDLCLEVGYKPTKNWLLTIGSEVLSGTSQTSTTNTQNNTFNPLFGTNHRFNGYMDYFYVGNSNATGLIDNYLRISLHKNKFTYSLNTHYFNSSADVLDLNSTSISAMNSHLGTELDFTLLYNYSDFVTLQGGYSQMFGTSTLQTLRGGSISKASNWSYLMLIVRPGNKKNPKVGLKM